MNQDEIYRFGRAFLALCGEFDITVVATIHPQKPNISETIEPIAFRSTIRHNDKIIEDLILLGKPTIARMTAHGALAAFEKLADGDPEVSLEIEEMDLDEGDNPVMLHLPDPETTIEPSELRFRQHTDGTIRMVVESTDRMQYFVFRLDQITHASFTQTHYPVKTNEPCIDLSIRTGGHLNDDIYCNGVTAKSAEEFRKRLTAELKLDHI